ncbi:hypothetical protein [Bacillus piscicola]|uniref:hypothetical protein n=1 Tax=Bacillus piscicola TaxID=1632684 RepID=UPI001F095015|nr:hypothetical protein [Bacillus piscicola]
MSWKAVELQVAIPRTQEVGKMQEQLQQRGQAAQDRLAFQQEREEEQERVQVTAKQQTEKNTFSKDQDSRHSDRDSQFHQRRRQEAEKDTPSPSHPYKGNTIDFTG